MRNFRKILSVLLTMVLIFGTMTIGAESAYYAYKDSAITAYDCIDKPILSTQQYASMLMDEVDRMLAKESLQVNEDLAGLLTIELDLRTVDSALNSVVSLWNTVSSMASTIGGDIQNLNFNAIINCPRRTTAGKNDGDILLALFQFLADNAGVLKKIPYGSVANGGLNLGIVAGFVDISEFLDLELLAKEAVAKLVYPDYKKDPAFATFDPKSMTLDQYISTFINLIASGTYNPDKSDTLNKISGYIAKYVPGFTSQVDLVNDSIYEIIEKCVRICLNSVVVPLANSKLKQELRKVCGIEYIPILDGDGKPVLDSEGNPTYTEDASNINEYAELLNIDFHLSPFSFSDWGTIQNDTFVNHINDIAGKIVQEIANPDNLTIDWNYSDGNAGLLDNIIDAAKQVLAITGNQFFAGYVEVLTPEQVAVMSDEEFVTYIVRSILNGSIDDVNIPGSCDTMIDVLFEASKSLASNYVPSRDYSSLSHDIDGILQIVADAAVYGLNQVTNMDLNYGISFDELADECFSWIESNYGGLVSEISGSTGWDKLSSLLFSIIPSSWLPNDDYGSPRDDFYSLLFDDILENILNLDIESILALLQRNDDPDADLNGTIIQVILGRIVDIFNYVIPGTFDTDSYSYDSLEGLLSPNLLSSLIENLFVGLNDRAPEILPSLLPLLCTVLDLSSAEKFGYPYISIPETLNPLTTSTFYMFNGSSGINTAFTNKNGVTTRDQLYKYAITGVETNQPGVTISPSTGTINGGESRTFTINGTPADDSVLSITITYNVYEETGAVMTPMPLKATCFTFVSDAKDDGSNKTKYDYLTTNTHLVYAYAKYLNQKSEVTGLAGTEFTLQRNVASQSTQHLADATFSLSSSVIDSSLSANGISITPLTPIATTRKGGAWPYAPYTVGEDATRPDDGIYQSRFTFFATPTNSAAETITFDHRVYFYDDFDLPSMFNSAVKSNRQQANYNQGSYDATYKDFYAEEDDDEITENVNGSTVWNDYIDALRSAAAIIYRPRNISSFQYTHADLYEEAAYNLYTAIHQLEEGSLSSGAASVKTALESFVAPCATKLNDEGEEVDVEYYENGYSFFGREDYVGYTYNNFKTERSSANKLINKWEDGEDIDAIEAAYVTHRLTLYGNRLIRVRAYKDYLIGALLEANAVQAGHYDAKTWENFVNARTFANAVAAEPIGTCVSGTELLAGDGLRQSKVNRAYSELVSAMKRLVSSVDYSQLREILDTAEPIYTAGNDNDYYTALSWSAFEAAYEDALSCLREKYQWSEENQLIVNNAYTALNNAFTGLETAAEPGINPVEIPGLEPIIINPQPYTYSSVDGNEVNFIYGIDIYNLSLDGLYEATGGAYVCSDYDYNDSYIDTTGARLMVYTDATKTTLVASYWVVVFGDINGDGIVENSDYGMLLDVCEYAYDWTWYTNNDNPWIYSCDLNHDGNVDGSDLNILLDVNDYEYMINQNWNGTPNDDYKIEY